MDQPDFPARPRIIHPFVELARLREKNRENLLETLNESEKEHFKKLNDAQANDMLELIMKQMAVVQGIT